VASPCSLVGKGRGPCVSMAVCYSRGVSEGVSCAKGSSALMSSQGSGAWMTSRGSNETERGQTMRRSARRLGRLSLCFGFERSKARADYDGPWAVIFILVGGFAVKMGYPILLVPDKETCLHLEQTVLA
jgi:hypothetical protein